tara:strand:+ start:3513 stop:3929 length:417 start_codon:yes stop_codon:yes gene_type:complete
MNMALYVRDYAGTGIKTPFDKMRANAMINARHDTRGMSIIEFNINAFLQQARHEDVYHILRLWAVEPLKRSPSKFQKYPEAGEKALYKRAQALKDNLLRAPHIGDWLAESASEHMSRAIEQELNVLHSNIKHSHINIA